MRTLVTTMLFMVMCSVDAGIRQRQKESLQKGVKLKSLNKNKEATMFIVVQPKKDDLCPLSLYYCFITKLNLSVLACKLFTE